VTVTGRSFIIAVARLSRVHMILRLLFTLGPRLLA
jgi:hypothetical protein